jgi:hypothetical protein
LLVCHFTKNQEAICTPVDAHAGGQKFFPGRVAPHLLHLKGWRIGKSGEDRIAISDVKVGENWTDDFHEKVSGDCRENPGRENHRPGGNCSKGPSRDCAGG